ncbi:GntR family transcriptional regulator [Rhizobium paknamense]|uniref:DNA-binding GntR family transcriptional regulator n=1 Tax=Rhizobium paknamense TaxID=1206817 RepID=A0ABU0IHT9_9HYPH|nr:GntR family transcriptional regulator [Rhizobium paknamense]MDQ0457833.1 DNA-binding GntR family transcriptional regulator [Rhizobium paknamense]
MTETLSENAMRVERPSKTLRELALDKLRDAILSGHFRPGDRLVERDLCTQLGVSRTIVREVLRHLESEGLVTSAGSRGPMVARLDADEARQIYEIRGALEGMAARLCAERRDAQDIAALEEALAGIRNAYDGQDMAGVLANTTAFYQRLFNSVGRHVAWGVVSLLTVRINHLRSMTIKTERRNVDGPAQMEKIIDAIRKGDGEAAEKAARDHVKAASAIAEALLQEPQISTS